MNDETLLRAFESCDLVAADFRHREHLRIAYLYLERFSLAEAQEVLRRNLLRLLAKLGAPPSTYHETITCAWLLAVNHLLHRVGPQESSEHFLAACDYLLDKDIMLTHYSPTLLFSPAARQSFVAPDREPIPRHRKLESRGG